MPHRTSKTPKHRARSLADVLRTIPEKRHGGAGTWVEQTLSPAHRAELDTMLRASARNMQDIVLALKSLGYADVTAARIWYYKGAKVTHTR